MKIDRGKLRKPEKNFWVDCGESIFGHKYNDKRIDIQELAVFECYRLLNCTLMELFEFKLRLRIDIFLF